MLTHNMVKSKWIPKINNYMCLLCIPFQKTKVIMVINLIAVLLNCSKNFQNLKSFHQVLYIKKSTNSISNTVHIMSA